MRSPRKINLEEVQIGGIFHSSLASRCLTHARGSMNSQSIDLEIRRPNRWHLATGTIVLTIAYLAVLILIGWLRR
jgi:hypothetical protein